MSKESTMPSPVLLDINDISAKLRLSVRTIWRLRDKGGMPQSLTLGKSVRWKATEIDAWVEAGCPPCQREGAAR